MTKDYKLKTSRVHIGESKIRWWEAYPEEGTPYKELFKPEYWSFNDFKFENDDMIRVIPDEHNYMAWLWVVSAGTGGTKVIEVMKKDLPKDAVEPVSVKELFEVKWAGPHHKYRVQRKSDDHIERANFGSEAEANTWLAENTKALIAQVA
jgi:hypothetical protein